MHQTIEFVSGTYFTVPTLALKTGESTSGGTGMIISTLLAIDVATNISISNSFVYEVNFDSALEVWQKSKI